MTSTVDVVVIGGGIVGTATAMALTERYRRSVVVLEAERTLAAHQSGHNSGVIHAGLYYQPGSQKARTCVDGRTALYRFCDEMGIAHRRCGKLIVATTDAEVAALHNLEQRGRANGLVGLRRVARDEIRDIEPAVSGLAGLWVEETGVVDFRAVTEAYASRIRDGGGAIRTGVKVIGAVPDARGLVIETTRGELRALALINCAGLHADRVARACRTDPEVTIVPFRGEYYEVVSERRSLVRNLIYPVPDPALPFLGAHFTRTIDDRVEAGPSAVLAFEREGYDRTSFSLRDTVDLLRFPGFRRMALRYWRTGVAEIARSLSKELFVRTLRRLIPELRRTDIRRAGSGVRAQAVDRLGNLLDDFYIVRGNRSLHVLNAPSPAATASIAIGRTLAAQLDELVTA